MILTKNNTLNNSGGLSKVNRESSKEEQKRYGDTDRYLFVEKMPP
jgi:hypothetical protein